MLIPNVVCPVTDHPSCMRWRCGVADSARAAVGAKLAKYKQPKHIHFVEALPRNAMGKVQKSALRDSFGVGPCAS